MKITTGGTTGKDGARLQMLKITGAMILLVTITISVFLHFYIRYNDNILYSERLNQMQDVTAQLFAGLESVVATQWSTADILCNYIEDARPEDEDALQLFIAEQAALNDMDTSLDSILAVDNYGRYYTQDGREGTLQELNYLMDAPERISYVSNTVTTNRTKMVFLNRLKTPVLLSDGTQIIYYGFTRDMTELEPYFNCAAYEENNSVYVVDKDGLKLFSSSQNSLIKGYNVYNVLEEMQYLHDTSFLAARKELEEHGNAYSNVMLDGQEYYYALYQMKSSEWILVFFINSNAVALNTVKLVNTTIRVVMIFAVSMAAVCMLIIFWMLRKQQKKELAASEANNMAITKINEKLTAAALTTENALKAAEAANHAKSDFLANMSHDIRTPMNAIVGITNLMEHEPELSDRMYTYIHKVQLSSQHLLSLINDILDMSKIESSDVALNIEPVNLADQVGQVDSIIRSQTNERKQTFHISVHEVVHENLLTDSVRLRQILLNLLSNATKYTPAGGTIKLDISERSGNNADYANFCISVTDTGYGMEPEFVKHIFEPFTRAENSTTNKIQGTGLGMAITKNIVDLMGGEIIIDSTPGKGSRFDVFLTLRVDRNADSEMDTGTVLLLAKEEALIRNVTASFSDTNITFLTASSIEDAAALLDSHPADVILLGGQLRNNTLAETVQLLRDKNKRTGLIFCVDYAQPEQAEKTLKGSGVDGLIPRPFFLSNLFHAIEQIDNKNTLEAAPSSVLKGLHFLCAEDNELNAEILEALLEMAGATCKIYSNGAELVKAFETVTPGEYDAILMDVQMPVMNGLTATRAIRNGNNPLGKTIPILAMTANAFSEDIRNSAAAGMDAHISKPIDISLLEKEMSRFLTPPPNP